MDKKYGVYICKGCGIGESLDVAALSGVAGEKGSVSVKPMKCFAARTVWRF